MHIFNFHTKTGFYTSSFERNDWERSTIGRLGMFVLLKFRPVSKILGSASAYNDLHSAYKYLSNFSTSLPKTISLSLSIFLIKMMKVTIKASCMVKPAEQTWSGKMPLSELDQTGICGHVPTFYFYTQPPQDWTTLLQTLKTSLSSILVHFYPLAGRLSALPRGRLELDCNAAGREAYADNKLPDLDTFSAPSTMTIYDQLIPSIDTPLEETPMLVLQVTRFLCGGFCLAIKMSHAVADGQSALHFTHEWARVSRGEALESPPYLDRKVLRAGEPPRARSKSEHAKSDPPPSLIDQSGNHEMETVVAKLKLTRTQVEKLRTEANDSRLNETSRGFSRYEVITAHVWRTACKARNHKPEQPTALTIPIDFRRKMRPPHYKKYNFYKAWKDEPFSFGNSNLNLSMMRLIMKQLDFQGINHNRNLVKPFLLLVTNRSSSQRVSVSKLWQIRSIHQPSGSVWSLLTDRIVALAATLYGNKLSPVYQQFAFGIVNELLSEEAVSSCSPAEICLKKLHRIPGYVKGRAATTKQVLATENLRMELELEKNKSKALEEEVKRIKEEHGKFQEEQNQMKKQMDFMMSFLFEQLVTTSNDLVTKSSDQFCRHKNMPLPRDYFGNAVTNSIATGCSGDIISNPLGYVASKIRDAIERVDDEHVNSVLDFLKSQEDISKFQELLPRSNGGGFCGDPNLGVTSWLTLPFHGADFGWGKEVHMDPGSHETDGDCLILNEEDGDGSLVVALCLKVSHMEDFKKLFYQDIDME
ncbi:LOW QUALITY PROTEIN: hypothetical protein OSB04_020813 [Centaurea solstitialis]|uniref:Uncharacterized protein n=1 Tax=Centaurea solstitialis TaxID=347529 RepID=A0AA38WDM1_9ASTR|nr:LOW QUALITY PROTEIN: hypothetical protein OSB04_020813 [Centaurea solstitialis]